ncbi:MAG TPA: hypothetical protein VF135_11555 [Terriglobales bacterium]
MSDIAQTWTANFTIVLGRLDATDPLIPENKGLCGAGECIAEHIDHDWGRERLNSMVNYWERLGILGPIYRLIGRGLDDHEIASRLNITEVNVRGCIAWLTHFLGCSNRAELIDYASASLPTQRDLRAA